MLGAQVVKNDLSRAGAAEFHILETLADHLMDACSGRKIKKALIGRRILGHGGGLAVDREHDGPLCHLEVAEYLSRMIAKRRHRLDVFGDVDVKVPIDTLIMQSDRARTGKNLAGPGPPVASGISPAA
jgi:hypothetical protein